MTAHTRPTKRTHTRMSKVANAADTIAGFGHNTDICGLTHGQFSLLDLLHATLDITGPADVDIATWSAGLYDVHAAERFRDEGRIQRIRFVMDAGRKNPHQPDSVDIADLFGADAIRTTRSHAKFCIIRNAEWNVLITSSMNLNLNPRVEQFEMTDDPGRAGLFAAWVDDVFAHTPAGGDRRTGDRKLPDTPNIPHVTPTSGITSIGTISTGGRIHVGE